MSLDRHRQWMPPSPAPAKLAGTFKLHKNNEEALSRHFLHQYKDLFAPNRAQPDPASPPY
jgi:hypothetical protein